MRSNKTNIFLAAVMITTLFAVAVPGSVSADWTGDVTIDSNGDVIPDTAPISVSGTIYSLTDNIIGTITIQKSGITLDGAGYSVVGIGDGNGIYMTGLSGVTLQNLAVSNFHFSIYMDDSSGSIIKENDLSNNIYYGILVRYSADNTVIDNIMSNNDLLGIRVYRCERVTVMGNIITGHFYNGINLYRSTGCIIRENTISENDRGYYQYASHDNTITLNNVFDNYLGIYLSNSQGNTVKGNTMTGNNYGFYLYLYSNSNIISGNTISYNDYGIFQEEYTSSNSFYHNNIIDNTIQVSSITSTNTWDNGYPSGGNYWSDYSGSDVKNGPNQDIPGSDGIGDTAYFIDLNNKDNYPLMEPWGLADEIEEVIEDIEEMDLPQGTENNLIQKLNDAILLLEMGNINGVIHKLGDFIDYIEAQTGKKITQRQANKLIEYAQWIIDNLSGA